MHMAAQLNNVMLSMILKNSKKNNAQFSVDLETNKGLTPVLVSVRQKHVESVRALIDARANIHKKYKKSGYNTIYSPYILAKKRFKKDTYADELLHFYNTNEEVKNLLKRLFVIMNSLQNKFHTEETAELLTILNEKIKTSIYLTPKNIFDSLKIEEILTDFLQINSSNINSITHEITGIKKILNDIKKLSTPDYTSDNRFYL